MIIMNMNYKQAIKKAIGLGIKYNSIDRRIPISYKNEFLHYTKGYMNIILGELQLFEKEKDWDKREEIIEINMKSLDTYVSNCEYLFGEQNE